VKPVKEKTLDELEETAVAGAKAIRAYLSYQGDNPTYRDKAKVSAAAISAYARTRASETNRQAIELMARRQTSPLALASGE
jgi:hypothetical protein